MRDLPQGLLLAQAVCFCLPFPAKIRFSFFGTYVCCPFRVHTLSSCNGSVSLQLVWQVPQSSRFRKLCILCGWGHVQRHTPSKFDEVFFLQVFPPHFSVLARTFHRCRLSLQLANSNHKTHIVSLASPKKILRLFKRHPGGVLCQFISNQSEISVKNGFIRQHQSETSLQINIRSVKWRRPFGTRERSKSNVFAS